MDDSKHTVIVPRWYSVAQVAQMLGFGLSKTPRCWSRPVSCAQSRTAKTAASCPSGWISTSNVESTQEQHD